jgi:hypothetical protein
MSVYEKCPFFDVMIWTIESESNSVHMTAAFAEIGAVFELEHEDVRVLTGD